MHTLPRHIILWDTEYTSWEGAQARDWSGENEYRELVQLGALRIDTETFEELDALLLYIKPVRNPLLSQYFIDLTHISQDDVERHGVSFPHAARSFEEWIAQTPCFAYGRDKERLDENYVLNNLPNPLNPQQFFDIRTHFENAGINTHLFMSSTIVEAFGKKSPHQGHDALCDARSIKEALRELAHGSPILPAARRT